MPGALKLFSLDCGRDFAARVAERLAIPLAAHEEREFEDGEHKCRPLESVRGCDVVVLQSLHGDAAMNVNDKLCRLLFFLGALRDASPRSLTVVAPYLCYARKDRRTKPRDPVTTRYLACLFEAVGIDRMVTLDAHNQAAYENAFRCLAEHLEAAPIFLQHFAPIARERDVVVVSPDVGGVKRARLFQARLEAAIGPGAGRPVGQAFMDKQRSGGVVSGETLVGAVEGRTAIVLDDLIASGTTMRRCAEACLAQGAREVYAAASHGLFNAPAAETFDAPCFERVVVTDSVPPFRLPDELIARKVTVLDSSALIAEAIRRIHTGGSLSELMDG